MSSLRQERTKKVKNLTRRLRNRQIWGDKICSISEVPREVLNSVGDEDEKSDKSRPSAPMSADQTQFIEIIRLLTDLAGVGKSSLSCCKDYSV